MKATFDLPPGLVREMKLRAVHEGRKLKDLAADLLERGLATRQSSAPPEPSKPRIEIQPNGVPVVRCGERAPASHMKVEELLRLEQTAVHQEDLQRLGHSF